MNKTGPASVSPRRRPVTGWIYDDGNFCVLTSELQRSSRRAVKMVYLPRLLKCQPFQP